MISRRTFSELLAFASLSTIASRVWANEQATGGGNGAKRSEATGSPAKAPARSPTHRVYGSARVEMADVDVPADVETLSVAGYHRPGDGGGGTYRRSVDAPRHDMAFRSADGSWWAFSPGASISVLQAGAVPDPTVDSTEAFRRAAQFVGSVGGGKIVVPKASSFRVSAPTRIFSSTTITGGGKIFATSGNVFEAIGGEPSPTKDFLKDVTVTDLTIEFDRPSAAFVDNMMLKAVNVRGLRVQKNRVLKGGACYLTHAIRHNRSYDLRKGSRTVDPAVLAGLSPTDCDDLNERFWFTDNEIDNTIYGCAGLRFEFCRDGVVSGNVCRGAAISGWGGSAIVEEGGDPAFLRRCRNVSLSNNRVSLANGACYLIDAQNCVIHGNTATDIIDTAFDLEGCINCVVSANSAENVGNFCYSIFYYSKNNVFTGNVGIQDGSARGINARCNTERFGPSLGVALFAIRGKGFPGVEGSQEVTVSNNEFRWNGAEGSGRISLTTYSRLTFSNNTMSNVVFDAVETSVSSGRTLIRGGEMEFTQNADCDYLVNLGAIDRGFFGAEVYDLQIHVKAPQKAGCIGIVAHTRAMKGPLKYIVARTKIHEYGKNFIDCGFELRVAVENNLPRNQIDLVLENNTLPSFRDTSSPGSTHTKLLKDNVSDGGEPIVVDKSSADRGIWVKGSVFRIADGSSGRRCAVEKTGAVSSAAGASIECLPDE